MNLKKEKIKQFEMKVQTSKKSWPIVTVRKSLLL